MGEERFKKKKREGRRMEDKRDGGVRTLRGSSSVNQEWEEGWWLEDSRLEENNGGKRKQQRG